ncbi:hypothetical protein AMATHDRAFT_11245 [Amanita thiersii Skay4041]|uniref:Uncharacterized protein n=1 Tax=Amanita thiersii Skay4041 TaxID=703135 RepID=A0A2A9N943_9AGAR|nr:hypothetical protein AMATHDRAFT_11245 [Amanita thiersii Skay4041]
MAKSPLLTLYELLVALLMFTVQPGTKGWSFLRSNGSIFVSTKAIFDESFLPRCKDTSSETLPLIPEETASDYSTEQDTLTPLNNNSFVPPQPLEFEKTTLSKDDSSDDDLPDSDETSDSENDNHSEEEYEPKSEDESNHHSNEQSSGNEGDYQDPVSDNSEAKEHEHHSDSEEHEDHDSSEEPEEPPTPPPRRSERTRNVPIRPGNIYGEQHVPSEIL